MANVRYGPIIGDARGALGGMVASRSPSGAVLRVRGLYHTPGHATSWRRSTWSDLTAAWAYTLTSDQRDAWNLAASTHLLRNSMGQTFHPSGHSLFLRHSMACSFEGTQAIIDDAPTPLVLPPGVFTVTEQSGSTRWRITWPKPTAIGGIYAGPRAWVAQTYRSGGRWPGVSFEEILVAYDAGTEIYTMYFPYALGEGLGPWLWCRIRILDAAGRISMPVLFKYPISGYY